jgi:hypothetical protein
MRALPAPVRAIVCCLALSSGFGTARAEPGAALPAPPPLKNWCEGGKDSSTCVSCEFHDCKLEDVHGIKATGIATFDMRLMTVTVRGDPSKLRLNLIGEADLEQYFATYEALPLVAGDPATVCEVDVREIGRDLNPAEARVLLTREIASAQEDTKVLGEVAGSFQGYDIRTWAIFDAEDKRYMLDMMLVFHDLGIEQTCRYKTQPAGTSEPHWAALSFSFAPAKRGK